MAVYRTTFPVAASPARVWEVIVDFERWHEWNPSVPSIRGDATAGSKLRLTLAMPGRPSAKVSAVLTDLEPERRFRWHGNVAGDWFFAGTRELLLEAGDGGSTLVTHVEGVTGAFFPVFRALMGSAIQQHHDNLNAAHARRAEASTSG
jgi:hypothetical protein